LTNYNYLPHTPEDREEMLKEIGLKSQGDLFSCIPVSLKETEYNLREGLSELEIQTKLSELAQKNADPRGFILSSEAVFITATSLLQLIILFPGANF
jgi:glycine cleavage system pyridoxal-binding protein P